MLSGLDKMRYYWKDKTWVAEYSLCRPIHLNLPSATVADTLLLLSHNLYTYNNGKYSPLSYYSNKCTCFIVHECVQFENRIFLFDVTLTRTRQSQLSNFFSNNMSTKRTAFTRFSWNGKVSLFWEEGPWLVSGPLLILTSDVVLHLEIENSNSFILKTSSFYSEDVL